MIDSCGCVKKTENNIDPQEAKNAAPVGMVNPNCPVCRIAGKKVAVQTVKAMLAVSLREIASDEFRFCPNETCDVVYFATDGVQHFTRSQIRERVPQKEPLADDVFVCYCFRFTRGDIRNSSAEGQASIVAEINASIQAGQCACDLRNPQGSCCLGNVQQLISQSG